MTPARIKMKARMAKAVIGMERRANIRSLKMGIAEVEARLSIAEDMPGDRESLEIHLSVARMNLAELETEEATV